MSLSWLQDFLPGRMAVDARERWRGVAGAALGIALTAWLCHLMDGYLGANARMAAWMVAPVGASAVLVFAVPSSPMAQPWAVVGGNTVCALVGIFCAKFFGPSELVAGAAVALAIAAMFAMRCLHPPGGACALLMVLREVRDPGFAFYPVMLNCVLLVCAGMAYNTWTGRRYPHRQRPLVSSSPSSGEAGVGSSAAADVADLQAALQRHNQVVDVSLDDLQALLAHTGVAHYRRRLGELACVEVMTRNLLAVDYGTPLQEAWALLRQHHIKALPVIDRARRVIGVVTLADFMAGAQLDLHRDWPQRLRAWLAPSPTVHTDKAEVVGQIMSRELRVARAEQALGELVPLFAATGHHHLPVVDGERRLVGIVTQSDVVAALCGRGGPMGEPSAVQALPSKPA